MYSSSIIVFTGTVHCHLFNETCRFVARFTGDITYIMNSSNIISFVCREFCTDSIRTTTRPFLLLPTHLLIPHVRFGPSEKHAQAMYLSVQVIQLTPSSSSKTSTLAILPTWKTPGRIVTLPSIPRAGCSFWLGFAPATLQANNNMGLSLP